MAAARTAKSRRTRVSFAKIDEPLEVPDLLALQTQSFDRLVGNAAWRERVAANAGGTAVHTTSGLEEVFEEICPIEDARARFEVLTEVVDGPRHGGRCGVDRSRDRRGA